MVEHGPTHRVDAVWCVEILQLVWQQLPNTEENEAAHSKKILLPLMNHAEKQRPFHRENEEHCPQYLPSKT